MPCVSEVNEKCCTADKRLFLPEKLDEFRKRIAREFANRSAPMFWRGYFKSEGNRHDHVGYLVFGERDRDGLLMTIIANQPDLIDRDMGPNDWLSDVVLARMLLSVARQPLVVLYRERFNVAFNVETIQ